MRAVIKHCLPDGLCYAESHLHSCAGKGKSAKLKGTLYSSVICHVSFMTHRDQNIKMQFVTLAWYCLRQYIINQLLIKIVPEKINKTFSTNYFLWKSLIRFLHFQQLLVNIKFLDYEGNHITYSRHLLSWKFKGNTFVTLHIIYASIVWKSTLHLSWLSKVQIVFMIRWLSHSQKKFSFFEPHFTFLLKHLVTFHWHYTWYLWIMVS